MGFPRFPRSHFDPSFSASRNDHYAINSVSRNDHYAMIRTSSGKQRCFPILCCFVAVVMAVIFVAVVKVVVAV